MININTSKRYLISKLAVFSCWRLVKHNIKVIEEGLTKDQLVLVKVIFEDGDVARVATLSKLIAINECHLG